MFCTHDLIYSRIVGILLHKLLKLLDRLAKHLIVLSGVIPFVDGYIPRQQCLHGMHERIVGARAIATKR